MCNTQNTCRIFYDKIHLFLIANLAGIIKFGLWIKFTMAHIRNDDLVNLLKRIQCWPVNIIRAGHISTDSI